MRIIAGQFRGRKLLTPQDEAIRPTSDRVRESLFNLLMHGKFGGEAIIDQHVVDLCCGTGAIGLEALSRGARAVTFIDKDKKSIELAKQNAMHCKIVNSCFFVQADVTRLPPAREPAALAFIDAPYDKPLLAPTYAALKAQGWLLPEALVVAEQSRDAMTPTLDGAELIDSRQYGKVAVHIYRFAG